MSAVNFKTIRLPARSKELCDGSKGHISALRERTCGQIKSGDPGSRSQMFHQTLQKQQITALPPGNVNFLFSSPLFSSPFAQRGRGSDLGYSATASESNSDVRLPAQQSIINRLRLTGAPILQPSRSRSGGAAADEAVRVVSESGKRPPKTTPLSWMVVAALSLA